MPLRITVVIEIRIQIGRIHPLVEMLDRQMVQPIETQSHSDQADHRQHDPLPASVPGRGRRVGEGEAAHGVRQSRRVWSVAVVVSGTGLAAVPCARQKSRQPIFSAPSPTGGVTFGEDLAVGRGPG